MQDTSQFKIWLKSRQIGGSFASAFEIVDDSWRRKTDWVVLSASERQSNEFLNNCIKAIESIHVAIVGAKGNRPKPTWTASEITFPNDSRILALPANDRTARGYSANLLLDEFAFHENPDEIWGAVFPIVSNPLRGKLKLRIVSTPCGIGNTFYKQFHSLNDFSKHKTTIWDAIKQGFQIDANSIKRNLNNDWRWRQEYECEFLSGDSDDSKVITTDMIRKLREQQPMPNRSTKTAFIDFGAGGDETVICFVEGNYVHPLIGWVDPDTMSTVGRCAIELNKFGIKPQHVFADEGGIGKPMIDALTSAGWNINRVNNGSPSDKYANKGAEMWMDAREIIQTGNLIIPDDDKLINQLCTRNMVFTSKGKIGLEPKDKLRSRGLSSPDRADAFCGALSCNRLYEFAHMNVYAFGNDDNSWNADDYQTAHRYGWHAG